MLERFGKNRVAALVTLSVLLTGFLRVGGLGAVQAATFMVTKTADTNDGVCNSDCSLREAIRAANAAPGADTINVPAGYYLLTRTGSDSTANNGDLDLTGPTTLIGAGAGLTIVDGNTTDRVFQIIGAQAVTLARLTIQRGGNQSSGSGVHVAGGTLTLTNVSLISNTVSSSGNGGALYFNGGALNLSDSTLSGNSAGNNGGAIYTLNAVTLTISASTFYNNSAKNGGGLYLSANGAAALLNSTFSANRAANGSGGGIRNYGALTLTHVTFANNSATSTGGAFRSSGTATLKNTLLANSLISGNCNGAFTSLGGNLSSDTSCAASLIGPGDRNNLNPLLNTLQDNGGPTFTHALLASSPAINTGNLAHCAPADQRGQTRDPQCDIGAYEVVNMGTAVPGPTTSTPTPVTPTSTPIPPTLTFTPTPVPPTLTDTPLPTETATALSTADATSTPTHTASPWPTDVFTPLPTYMRFAIIGDYGFASPLEADVATRVKSWNPEFILTAGDNNYPTGDSSTIDANIGQYYQEFIFPYTGTYGAGSPTGTNRFWPSPGNHDWDSPTGLQPYLDYFTLPGNERYYAMVIGDIHFFMLDSDSLEPDGRSSTSVQAQWLQSALAASTTPWQVVILHHPPYSSGLFHGSQLTLQWPYAAWGADVVIAGHDHTYERILLDGIVYFVNGLSGRDTHTECGAPIAGSQLCYDVDFGAMLVLAHASQITFQFITHTGAVIDTYTLPPGAEPPTNTPTPLITDTPTPTVTPSPTSAPSDFIFADGFESGNLAAWSASAIGGGDLSVTATAALVGSQGLQAAINDLTNMYVQDNTPFGETRYRARFYFDPNSMVMAANEAHTIFQGLPVSGGSAFQLNVRYVGGVYQIQAQVRNDDATWTNLLPYALTDAPHAIEIDWQAAASAGANNGAFTLWLDGILKESKTALDNDLQRIDQVKLGPVYGLDAGTVGVEYFDAFESRRITYIGP